MQENELPLVKANATIKMYSSRAFIWLVTPLGLLWYGFAVEPPWATTSRKRPPNQNPDGSYASQIAISETSPKRPPKPDIEGVAYQKVPL